MEVLESVNVDFTTSDYYKTILCDATNEKNKQMQKLHCKQRQHFASSSIKSQSQLATHKLNWQNNTQMKMKTVLQVSATQRLIGLTQSILEKMKMKVTANYQFAPIWWSPVIVTLIQLIIIKHLLFISIFCFCSICDVFFG